MIDPKIKEVLEEEVGKENVDTCILYIIAKCYDLSTDGLLINDYTSRVCAKYLVKSQNGYSCKVKVFVNDNNSVQAVSDYIQLAEQIRGKFKGLKALSMGDRQDCINKTKRFLKEHPKYSFDEILAATDYYIENTPPKYIRRANYFLYKHTAKGEELSELATILEELKENKPQSSDYNFISSGKTPY